MSASARSAPPLLLVIVRVLPFFSVTVRVPCGRNRLAQVGATPRRATRPDRRRASPPQSIGVERDAHRERRRLDERAGGVGHAEREHELVELRQEERGDRGRDEVAAAAEQRGAAEHDGCDGRQEVVVALVGRRLVDDAGVQHGGEAVEELRPDVGAGPVALHPDPCGAGGGLVRADALEASARRRQLDHRRDDGRGDDSEVHRSRDAEPEPAAEARQAGGGRASGCRPCTRARRRRAARSCRASRRSG